MKKLIVIAIVVTMSVVAIPAVTRADTIEALQAQIESLLAQVKALQAQISKTAPATDAPDTCQGVSFTRNLSMGLTGNDVKCLQALLNQDSATQIAASGVGSAGNETTYFGSLTRTAVVKFQNKYASEVLAPVGLTTGTGFVGAQTRAKLSSMLLSSPIKSIDSTEIDIKDSTREAETREELTVSSVHLKIDSIIQLSNQAKDLISQNNLSEANNILSMLKGIAEQLKDKINSLHYDRVESIIQLSNQGKDLISQNNLSEANNILSMLKGIAEQLKLPTIEVISPNGQEVLSPEQSIQINWESSELLESDNINIWLNAYYSMLSARNSDSKYMIARNLSGNITKYDWKIPNIFTLFGKELFKVQVSVFRNNKLIAEHFSDDYFSILPKTVSEIEINSPKGDEQWRQATTQKITWTGGKYDDGSYSKIDIDLYSADCKDRACALSSRKNIVSNEFLSGSYNWQITDLIEKGNYFIEICAVDVMKLHCKTSDIFSVVSTSINAEIRAMVAQVVSDHPVSFIDNETEEGRRRLEYFDLNEDGYVDGSDFAIVRDIKTLNEEVFEKAFTKLMRAVADEVDERFDLSGDGYVSSQDYIQIHNALSEGRNIPLDY